MANHKSAKKRITRNESKRQENKSFLSAIRKLLKSFETAITSGNKDEAKQAFVKAESGLAKTAQKGRLKRNTVARKTSRMSAKLKAMK